MPANVDTERSPRVTVLVERGPVTAEAGVGSNIRDSAVSEDLEGGQGASDFTLVCLFVC